VSVAAIGIIWKAPQPGRSKTRLAPAIGDLAASELSACFSATSQQASRRSQRRSVDAATAFTLPQEPNTLCGGCFRRSLDCCCKLAMI